MNAKRRQSYNSMLCWQMWVYPNPIDHLIREILIGHGPSQQTNDRWGFTDRLLIHDNCTFHFWQRVWTICHEYVFRANSKYASHIAVSWPEYLTALLLFVIHTYGSGWIGDGLVFAWEMNSHCIWSRRVPVKVPGDSVSDPTVYWSWVYWYCTFETM